MFYAKVIIGESITMQPDKKLKMPPLLPDSQELRYDSIKGHTHGHDVYMIYANKKAYPSYLITYSAWNNEDSYTN